MNDLTSKILKLEEESFQKDSKNRELKDSLELNKVNIEIIEFELLNINL